MYAHAAFFGLTSVVAASAAVRFTPDVGDEVTDFMGFGDLADIADRDARHAKERL
jgi:hypothetical protein